MGDLEDTLTGTLGLAGAASGFDPVQQGDWLSQNMGGLQQFIQSLGAAKQEGEAEKKKRGFSAAIGEDGTVTLKGPGEDILKGLQGAQSYQKLLQGYSEQLAARQAQTQAHPVGSLLAQLAGNLAASDPKLPGFVRGLGLTAQQLNPTVQQLQGQQMGIAQTLAQLQNQQLQQTLAIRQDAREQSHSAVELARESRIAKEAPVKDFLRVQGEHLTAAAKGELDPQTATASLVQSGLLSPENAPAYQAQLQGAVERFGAIKDKAAKEQLGRDIFKATLAADSQARTFAQQDAILAKRLAAQAADLDKRLAASEAKTAAKDAKLPQTVQGQLKELTAADNALNEVEKVLANPDLTKNMGPIMGRIAQANPYRRPEDQGVITQLKLQTANAIKSTGAGARGFGPQERPFFEKLSEGIQNTPEQNRAILEKWRDYLDQERKAIVSTYNVDWNTYGNALGPRLAPQKAAPIAVPQGWKIEVVK